jgi:phospholipid/cholesterol/gamma-HCH transport system substrate-binding protein
MNPRVSYTLAGLFVLLLGGGLVTAIVWLSSATTDQRYEPYVAYFYESVGGLNPNASVTYRGVRVGQVRDIQLDRERPERVRVLLDIEEGTPVKTDTVAILVTQGITGLAHVELTGGSSEAPLIGRGSAEDIPEIPTRPSLWCASMPPSPV